MSIVEKVEYTSACRVTIQPGDGTRYRFMIVPEAKGYVFISGVDCTRFNGYTYSVDDIKHCFLELPKTPKTPEEFCHLPLIRYMHDYADCSYWEARAAVLAAINSGFYRLDNDRS